MRRFKRLLVAIAASIAGFAAPAYASGISVAIDQARIINFSEPVSTVYVGNPTMADISVIDPKRAFILGKAFGTTNLIALDAKGNVLTNVTLTVHGLDNSTVTLNRGSEQYTFACANSRCEAAPVPGDATQYYSSATGESTQRQDTGAKAAMASK